MEKVTHDKNDKLKEIFISKNGTKFYGFVEPLNIPPTRGLAAEKAIRFMGMRLTNRSLKALIQEIKTLAGASDLVGAFSIVQEIEYRLNFMTEESSILDLVCIYFVIDGEDPEVPTEEINRKKHKIFEEDPQARAFFLRIGISLSKELSGKREEDVLAYLEENEPMSERIRRYIPEESSINSMSS